MTTSTDRTRRGVTALLSAVVICLAGCATVGPGQPMEGPSSAEIEVLRRAPDRTLSALYRLRVPSSGGLRLAVTDAAEEIRIGVSEPFGSALSLTTWRSRGGFAAWDLRRGCQVAAVDLRGALGVPSLPLPQLARLLAGRLPAVAGDSVTSSGNGAVLVEGAGLSCRVDLEPDPWRVVRVEPVSPIGVDGWRLEVGDHTSSLPGFVRVDTADGRWAEIELVRLEWGDVELPALPTSLPPCSEVEP